MIIVRALPLIALCFLLNPAAKAQAYKPQHDTLLRQALQAVAGGECPPRIMTPMLQYQCQKAKDVMQSWLKTLGALQEVQFRGTQATPGGPGEVYVAKYERGEMMWIVATDTDGKLQTFWSPG
jgi:hypothetical protein